MTKKCDVTVRVQDKSVCQMTGDGGGRKQNQEGN